LKKTPFERLAFNISDPHPPSLPRITFSSHVNSPFVHLSALAIKSFPHSGQQVYCVFPSSCILPLPVLLSCHAPSFFLGLHFPFQCSRTFPPRSTFPSPEKLTPRLKVLLKFPFHDPSPLLSVPFSCSGEVFLVLKLFTGCRGCFRFFRKPL